MSPSKGHGLRPEDVDLIFPDSPAGSPGPTRPDPITPIDFKRRASGEKDDVRPQPDEDAWSVEDTAEPDPSPPTFEEPWPSPIEDAPEDSPIEATAEPDPEEEIDLDPGRERRHAVQELGNATGRSMIDGMADPKPGPVRAERKKLEAMPSSKFWFAEMRRILGRQP